MEKEENKLFSHKDMKKIKGFAIVLSALLVAYYASTVYVNYLNIKKIKGL